MILRIKSQLEELIFNGDYLSGQPFKRGSLKADIRALITITNKYSMQEKSMSSKKKIGTPRGKIKNEI